MILWNLVRLELASTPDFPEGSASRAYMLCLPLDAGGRIDATAVARQPAMATARRFWPNEPDRSGCLVYDKDGWAISFEPGVSGGETLVHLETSLVRLGDCLSLRKSDGRVCPFLVASVRPDGCAAY